MGNQIDGDHYEKMPIQPWDIIKAHQLDYWAGTIVKYVLRAGKKDGVLKSVDLKKAADFLNEYIGIVEAEEKASPQVTVTIHPALADLAAAIEQPWEKLYRCPNGHDVPGVPPKYVHFVRHNIGGAWGDAVQEQDRPICEFSGKYVGETAADARSRLPYGAVVKNDREQYRCSGCDQWVSESAKRKGRLASHRVPNRTVWCTFGTPGE